MRLTKTYSLAGLADERLPSLTTTTAPDGTFEAIVSVFGNTDYQGDRVMPKAFLNSIAKLRATNTPVSIIHSHDWADPFANVGVADPRDIRELQPGENPAAPKGGLYVKGRFDIEKPYARQIYDLVKAGRISQWSFSYDTIKEKKASDGANELLELDLIEAGPTLRGANDQTRTLSIKSMNDVRANEGLTPVKGLRIIGQHEVTCGICHKRSLTEVFAPVPSGNINWCVTDCYQMLGFSKRSTPVRQHVLEMDRIKMYVADLVLKISNKRDADLRKALDDLDPDRKYIDQSLTVTAQSGEVVHVGDVIAYATVSGVELQAEVQAISDEGVFVSRSHGHRREIVAPGDVLRVISSFELRGTVSPHSENCDLAAQVDALVADVRAEKAREDADRKALDDANSYLHAITTE